MSKSSTQFKSSLLLLLAATIWGTAFVAQSVAMDHVGGFTFNSVRNLIGALVLLPVILFRSRTAPSDAPKTVSPASRRILLIGGLLCGLLLCLASNFQQFGIKYTTVGKAGFITACYIVLVPIFGLFLRKKCSPLVWAAVALAVIGLYLLCITDQFSLGTGDLLCMICSALFAIHILVVDHFAPQVDGVKLSCIQFLVCGILSGIPALLLEHPDLASLVAAAQPILYAGVMSSGVAYTLQIIGQKNVQPTIASLILSLESCISVISGWLILGQVLTSREIFGCVLMFAAILLAQLPWPAKKPERNSLKTT